jgi:hypothetical protein
MKKRILILALAFILTLALIPTVMAADGETRTFTIIRDTSGGFLGDNGWEYEITYTYVFTVTNVVSVGTDDEMSFVHGTIQTPATLTVIGIEVIATGNYHSDYESGMPISSNDGLLRPNEGVPLTLQPGHYIFGGRMTIDGKVYYNISFDVVGDPTPDSSPDPTPGTPAPLPVPDPVSVVPGKDLQLAKIDRPLADLTAVKFGDKVLEQGADKDYTAREGSTIITLTQRFLDTLPAGTHTIAISFGAETVEQKVVKADTPAAPTGDNTMIALVFAILLLAACGAVLSARKVKTA